jgi:hypothetical protein
VRLLRKDGWDDATRGEWEDIKRWGHGLLFAGVVVVAYLVARLVTTSYLEQLGIVAGVSAIFGLVTGRLERRRSRVNAPEPHSDAPA